MFRGRQAVSATWLAVPPLRRQNYGKAVPLLRVAKPRHQEIPAADYQNADAAAHVRHSDESAPPPTKADCETYIRFVLPAESRPSHCRLTTLVCPELGTTPTALLPALPSHARLGVR